MDEMEAILKRLEIALAKLDDKSRKRVIERLEEAYSPHTKKSRRKGRFDDGKIN